MAATVDCPSTEVPETSFDRQDMLWQCLQDQSTRFTALAHTMDLVLEAMQSMRHEHQQVRWGPGQCWCGCWVWPCCWSEMQVSSAGPAEQALGTFAAPLARVVPDEKLMTTFDTVTFHPEQQPAAPVQVLESELPTPSCTFVARSEIFYDCDEVLLEDFGMPLTGALSMSDAHLARALPDVMLVEQVDSVTFKKENVAMLPLEGHLVKSAIFDRTVSTSPMMFPDCNDGQLESLQTKHISRAADVVMFHQDDEAYALMVEAAIHQDYAARSVTFAAPQEALKGAAEHVALELNTAATSATLVVLPSREHLQQSILLAQQKAVSRRDAELVTHDILDELQPFLEPVKLKNNVVLPRSPQPLLQCPFLHVFLCRL